MTKQKEHLPDPLHPEHRKQEIKQYELSDYYSPSQCEQIKEAYYDLRSKLSAIPSNDLSEELDLAFRVAFHAHRHQIRKSGEPYILHPIEVARIAVDEIQQGKSSAIIALLHDVVEDSDDYNLVDIEMLFGDFIARCVDSLTKVEARELDHLENKGSKELHTLKKIFDTFGYDLRIVYVKLADRMHNMRTLDAQKPSSQIRISLITNDIYVLIAQRLGLHEIRSELEDLCMRYLDPVHYFEIKEKLKQEKGKNKGIDKVVDAVEQILEKRALKGQIKHRVKTITSIYNKMVRQGVDFEGVYDKYAVRVILDLKEGTTREEEISECFFVYSMLTARFTSTDSRYRDFLTKPKSNGYQSLHNTFQVGKHHVEVQIRTLRMDTIAEFGVAAHFQYKDLQAGKELKEVYSINSWLKEFEEAHERARETDAGMRDEIRYGLYLKEIIVRTPKGDYIRLPKGSGILDFAYKIHTDIGNTCIGGRVNGVLKGFSHELKNDDVVQIQTSSSQHPKASWLDLVKTQRASDAIRSSLAASRTKHQQAGKDILERRWRVLGIENTPSNLQKFQNFVHCDSLKDLYYNIGVENVIREDFRAFKNSLNRKFIEYLPPFLKRKKSPIKEKKKKKEPEVKVIVGSGKTYFPYELAECCNPTPASNIFALPGKQNSFKIHSYSCPNTDDILKNSPLKLVEAFWSKGAFSLKRYMLTVHGIDNSGVVNTASKIMNSYPQVAVTKIDFGVQDGLYIGNIQFTSTLDDILKEIKEKMLQIEGVSMVEIEREETV